MSHCRRRPVDAGNEKKRPALHGGYAPAVMGSQGNGDTFWSADGKGRILLGRSSRPRREGRAEAKYTGYLKVYGAEVQRACG